MPFIVVGPFKYECPRCGRFSDIVTGERYEVASGPKICLVFRHAPRYPMCLTFWTEEEYWRFQWRDWSFGDSRFQWGLKHHSDFHIALLEASARSLSWTLIFYALFLTIVAADVSTFWRQPCGECALFECILFDLSECWFLSVSILPPQKQ